MNFRDRGAFRAHFSPPHFASGETEDSLAFLQMYKFRNSYVCHAFCLVAFAECGEFRKSYVKKSPSNYIFSWKPYLILKFLKHNGNEAPKDNMTCPTSHNWEHGCLNPSVDSADLVLLYKEFTMCPRSGRFDNTSLPSQNYIMILTVEYFTCNS